MTTIGPRSSLTGQDSKNRNRNKKLPGRFLAGLALAAACLLSLPATAWAQLPTPTRGWNLGNTLEAIPTEGSWGPVATQNVINAVADAGFNTVRIPCAWGTHSDQSTLQIDPAYIARVKQVVDWCYARNLYVVINCHWDKGWLDYNIDPSLAPPDVVVDSDSRVHAKMNSYWTQVANAFKGYDNRLLFAGANEPPVKNATQMSKLISYYQTFINAVRATGGNNSSRWLVLSGPSTDIDATDQLMNTLPNDWVAGRLAVEVHYYAPFQFCLMDKDASWGSMFYFWGQGYHSATLTNRNATWGEEAFVDTEFEKMRTKFISRGIPVIIGEFAAMKRSTTDYPDLAGTELLRHYAAHTYFHKYVVDSANAKGLKPIYWDTPGGDFDWTTGAVGDRDNVRALTGGAALPPPDTSGIIANGIYKIVARHSGKALDVAGARTADGTNVQQWAYWGGENERWVVRHLGNNQYSIIGLQSGKALDVDSWRTNDGANVQIWTYGGSNNQIWTVTATSGGYYRLSPKHAPNMGLDVSGSSPDNQANIQIWTYFGGPNQQWAFQAP